MLRPLTEKDFDAAIKIINENWKKTYSTYINPQLLGETGCNARAEELRHDFLSKRLSEYVWEEQGQILAQLSIGDTSDPDKKGAFEIWRVYVAPQAQGHHIGRQCLAFAEQEAKKQGYQEIIIWAFQKNDKAIRFYQRNGYRIDKQEYLGEPYLAVGTRLKKELKSSMDITNFKWTRHPKSYHIDGDSVEIITAPHTDLWQRTYYHFQNDNAPVLQMETDEKFFSFVVKTDFSDSHHRFDQCGIVMYLDGENWLKGSVEYENEDFQHLGSVVTNGGYSDWATTAIPATIKSMWYRLSRREDDYCIECSKDGVNFSQIRICHMNKGKGKIQFGIYACSPEDSSFKAVFTDMKLMECQWKAHDGQQPD